MILNSIAKLVVVKGMGASLQKHSSQFNDSSVTYDTPKVSSPKRPNQVSHQTLSLTVAGQSLSADSEHTVVHVLT